jgi:hypothetical protein
MNADIAGPPVSFALFLTGIWIGWRMARLREGEVSIPTHGFGRGAAKPFRIAAAFGATLAGVLLGFISEQVNSIVLGYVAVAIVAVSIGVGWGAGIRGWHGT